MVTVEEVWNGENAKNIELLSNELKPVKFLVEYQELCRGSLEPTDILVNDITYELLCENLSTDKYSFRVYKRFNNAVVNFSGAANRIILMSDPNKLNEQQLRFRKEQINKGKHLATIFTISNYSDLLKDEHSTSTN